MTEIHFTNLLIVVAAAFAAPFLLGLAPRVRLPSVVLLAPRCLAGSRSTTRSSSPRPRSG
jgi:hypothetical protein